MWTLIKLVSMICYKWIDVWSVTMKYLKHSNWKLVLENS